MGTKATILIVEDNPEFRQTLSDIVRLQGYAPLAAAKGKTAVNRVKKERPAVALIDLKLPDMDGLEVMREIKKRSPDTECIVLTGYGSQASAIEAVNLGAYGYMQKPYDVEQLVLTIRRAVEKREAEEAIKLAYAELDQIFNTAAGGMRVVDKEFNVVRVNETFSNLSGISKDEAVGKKCYEVFPGPVCDTPNCPLTRILGGDQRVEYDTEKERSGGTRIPCTVTATPFRGSGGELIGIVEDFKDITERKGAEEALKSAALETLEALSRLVEANDPYTSGHSAIVTEIAIKIAQEMGLGEDLDTLEVAGLLHDLGKVGIPGSVLNKPARLTQAERMMVEAHPVLSAEIAERVTAFRDAVPVIRHHHEWYDGNGYPDGLKGDDIPLLARILAVADGFEAMTSERPYRRAFTEEEAIAELQKGAGSQWDPNVVEAFVKICESGIIS